MGLLHAGPLFLQAGGFLCNPHYEWKVNSSTAAGQSILGRLSVGEAASGRGERNECEASHPVTAPSPIFSQPLLPTSASRGAPPGSCGSCWGWRGLAVELHMRRQPGLTSSLHLIWVVALVHWDHHSVMLTDCQSSVVLRIYLRAFIFDLTSSFLQGCFAKSIF